MKSHLIICSSILFVALSSHVVVGGETEETLDKYIARSADGRLRLEVEIYRPQKSEYEVRMDENGHELHFYKGKKVDAAYADSEGYAGFITKFEFTWDGQRIDIPRRFWDDLMMPLSGVVKDVDKMGPDELAEFEAEQYEALQFRPRLSVSSSDSEGTAMIEWSRSLLSCDTYAVERWIISKKGAVLRHTFISPHRC